MQFYKIITLFGWELFFILEFSLLFFMYFKWYNLFTFAKIIILFFILESIWALIKIFFFKDRPHPMQYNNLHEKILAGSFPSLHTGRTFLLFLLFIYYLNIFYLNFTYFLLFICIAYSRVILKKHFWVDILWGIIISWLLFLIYIKFS